MYNNNLNFYENKVLGLAKNSVEPFFYRGVLCYKTTLGKGWHESRSMAVLAALNELERLDIYGSNNKINAHKIWAEYVSR